jgi:hypothetical protein
MGLAYSFKAAKKKIARLDDDERVRLTAICDQIRRSQEVLSEKAVPILENCMASCRGLCCRNIRPADIITEWDLIYILTLAPEAAGAMADSLDNEPFFASDCIFLENGTGPCLFPDNIRPERCIISFCRVEPTVADEIKAVMAGFSRLIRFFQFRPFRRMVRRLRPSGSPAPPDGC